MVTSAGCETWAELEPQMLGLTYWFDAPPAGDPSPMQVRFEGRRVGVEGRIGPRDKFSVVDSVNPVIPGVGRVALTTRIGNVAPGAWRVTAVPVTAQRAGSAKAGKAGRPSRSSPRGSASGQTTYGPVVRVRAPGVRIGAWPLLVAVGTIVALFAQGLLAARLDLPAGPLLVVSLAACAVGLVGGKLYYWATHRDEQINVLTLGTSIQGFVLGAIATVIAGALLVGIPLGAALDATTPGMLLGMSIGRWGCLLGGCCAGRPTASRWGVWSSDRRLGIRRVPVQLFESALTGALGSAAALAVWAMQPRIGGLLFVGAFAAYTLGRQLLFPLRVIPRLTSYGRGLTRVIASVVLVADLVAILLAAAT